jgi:hypothetical protein
MEQRIFNFIIDYRGLQFIMPLKAVYNRKLVSVNKNVFLNIAERLKPEKDFKITLFLS